MKNILLLTILLFSNIALADSHTIQFLNGWIKQLPPVVPMRAGYMQIKNSSDQNKEITSVQSNAFEVVEMHETTMADGMMKMTEMESLVIPAKQTVELKPGGKHLMLISPINPLQIGQIVEVIVTYSDSSTQAIHLEVKK